MKPLALTLFLTAFAVAAQEIKTETVDYKDGNVVLSGFLAYDASITGKRPGILVCHAWKGLGKHEMDSARELAKLGYVAFALDIYGKGVRAKNAKEARALATKYRGGDRKLLRQRANVGLAKLKSLPRVDAAATAAIGYCFGGTTVLEMARSGAATRGVVSFHGGLTTNAPEDAKNIKAKVLVLHGGDDPHAPMKDVVALADELRAAKVDWQIVLYGGAVHSFTDPGAGNDPSRGAAYDKQAARRSWEAMQDFFRELFGKTK